MIIGDVSFQLVCISFSLTCICLLLAIIIYMLIRIHKSLLRLEVEWLKNETFKLEKAKARQTGTYSLKRMDELDKLYKDLLQ